MTAVSPGLQKALIAAAARAPSAHNTQPALWRFPDNGCIELLEDRTRLLPCADPLESDHRLALGIAYEGLSLAASSHGRILEEPSFVCEPEALALAGGRYRPVAGTRVAGARAADPLAEWVHIRATWRGRFVQPSRQRLRELISTLDHRFDLRLITRSRDLRAFGGLHDRCAGELLTRLGHAEELWRWLRLSPDHPEWGRDGLNADALNLSARDRKIAALLLRPNVLRYLQRMRLDALLISEAPITRSASLLLVMMAEPSELRFDTGRRLYRLWLELTALGWSACPMSALVDHPRGRDKLKESLGLDDDRELVAVMRVGLAPGPVRCSPRLPLNELVLE